MDAALREFVRQRAGDRCEYCHLPQEFSELHFHVEHIIPRQHGGTEDSRNLALACPECNLAKGPNLTGIEPDRGKVVRLFDPRRDKWTQHFAYDGARIAGKTSVEAYRWE
ncbi:MAG: HNH endonuclease signature motif containing protein [Verrucomicrobiota bacterium]|jgi:5-methylcytosine-specific restriction endonuclease McrA